MLAEFADAFLQSPRLVVPNHNQAGLSFGCHAMNDLPIMESDKA